MLRRIGRLFARSRLPHAALAERRKDRRGLPEFDPGVDRAIFDGIGWICLAQDQSRTSDGGVARHFSLIDGWSSSYPETTGYIVPTMLAHARTQEGAAAEETRDRARRMLDWLVSIQFPEGGFQGGMVDQTPVVPVIFNTGQILLGLAAGVEDLGPAYLDPMTRAADWLVDAQDADGCWRKFPTPFAAPGEKAYETHVAWGLLEAARVHPDDRHREAALKNIRWALGWQRENGWFDRCCLQDPTQPLTHTIGYVLRGVLEGYRSSGDPALLCAARKTADGVLSAIGGQGFLPGRLDARWRGTVRWTCLTGSVQIATCLLMLHEATREPRYRDAALTLNKYVRRMMAVDGPPEVRGGIKGSFPVDGGYGTYQYLNWACKFFIDANRFEKTSEAEACEHGPNLEVVP